MNERRTTLLTGQGCFVDDVALPDLAHARVLRSPLAHARINTLRSEEARRCPGVLGVFTHQDLGPTDPIPVRLAPRSSLAAFRQWPLASTVVRYVGEPIALVVAEDPYLAEDAARAIEVDYTQLDPILSVDPVDEPSPSDGRGHVAADFEMVEGDVATAFAEAAHVVEGRFSVQRHYACPIETRGLVAWWNPDSEVLELWGDSKVPQFNRKVLAEQLGLDPSSIRVHCTDVGGGFGARGELYPENFLIPWAALRLRRPVKWIEDRCENLRAMNHSREVVCDARLAADAEGRLLGLQAEVRGDMGAYIRTHGALVPTMTAALLPGPYRIPACRVRVLCCMTNKTGTGTYRGPGYFESTFVRERLLDNLAQKLGIEPVELRLRNLVTSEELPYTLGSGHRGNDEPEGIHLGDSDPIILDTGDYPKALEVARERIGRSAGRKLDGCYHGVGYGCFVEPTAFGGKESARVSIDAGARVLVEVGISNLGQDHQGLLGNLCAEALGVPAAWVDVRWGDSELGVESLGTFGSRVSVMCGSALTLAARELRQRLLEVCAPQTGYDAGELTIQEGWICHRGTQRSLRHLAEADYEIAPITHTFESSKSIPKTYSYGAHAARVAVDPDTGGVEILDYVVVEDVGRCLDRTGLEGQVTGAVVQGIGGTFLESLTYDPEGQPLVDRLNLYRLPWVQDLPPIQSVILEDHPTPHNPLGAKGGGEGGIVATGAALSGAVHDALRPLGVEIPDLPLDPGRIWAAIASAGARHDRSRDRPES